MDRSIFLFQLGGIKWELSRQVKRKEERYFTRKHSSCGITNFPKNEKRKPHKSPEEQKTFHTFHLVFQNYFSLFIFGYFFQLFFALIVNALFGQRQQKKGKARMEEKGKTEKKKKRQSKQGVLSFERHLIS